MKQLKGKIYWVSDTFEYIGKGVNNSKDIYLHYAARISNIVIDDAMIKFDVEPHNVEGGSYSYIVNLLNTHENRFKGDIKDGETNELNGNVTCELFQNSKKYMIQGLWHEEHNDFENIFSFWAVIEK